MIYRGIGFVVGSSGMVVWIRFLLNTRHIAVASAFVFVLALLLCADPVLAQRRGKSSRTAKANAARKQQEIAQLQKQLDGSRKLLESVTSRGAMTQAQLAAARQSALSAREALQEAVQQENEINKKLRGIEDDILDAQSDDSEYAKALDDIHLAQRAMDTELHRILKRTLPADDEDEATRLSELAHLTIEEREKLAADSRYTAKQHALHLAMDQLRAVKTKLFQASDEWKKAHEERHRINQEEAQQELSVQGAANNSSASRKELQTTAEIAASARASIAQAEARLKALGAKPKAPTPEKKKSNP
jgi:septal ring factor EnvC (AmiA/AmiB activator)